MCLKSCVICLALAVGLGVGCEKQCFLNEGDFARANALGLPANLDCDPNASAPRGGRATPPPTTVLDTKREPRYLTLREALAIALENGTVGAQSPTTPGLAIDTLGAFAGTSVISADSIRVLALDPAIISTNTEISLAKFDTLWNTALNWTHTETPLGTSPTLATVGVPSTVASITSDNVLFSSGLEKPLPTGGVAGITFNTTYLHSSPTAAISPAYQPDIQFQFEQPLLQGFGVEVNQVRPSLPGSLLNPFPVGGQVEGVVITRIRLDQQRAEFERNLNFMLLNVEAAYWNLYGAYFQLYSREEGMRFAYESWRLTRLGLEAGRATEQALEQTRLQYENFRSQRLQTLGLILESERQLRGLLNLPVEDGTRLIPVDAPTLAPVVPDWRIALEEALTQRPELTLARQDLKFRQIDMIRARDLLLPDLRFVATDDIHSIGTQLDGGPVPGNALHNLSDPFNNFTLGLRMNVPIGFRSANAGYRAARLNLERSYLSLRTEEDKAERFLGLTYRQLFEFQQQIEINQAAFRAATLELQRFYELFRLGRGQPFGADLILAQRDWVTALSTLYTFIVNYNNALVQFEFAKGTILQHDSIYIADGPLPNCVRMRAVEHERERTRALVLCQRKIPADGGACPAEQGPPAAPQLPLNAAVPLPVLQNQPPVPELPQAPAAAMNSTASLGGTAASAEARPLPSIGTGK